MLLDDGCGCWVVRCWCLALVVVGVGNLETSKETVSGDSGCNISKDSAITPEQAALRSLYQRWWLPDRVASVICASAQRQVSRAHFLFMGHFQMSRYIQQPAEGKKTVLLKTKDINTPCSLTGTKVDAWHHPPQPKNPRPSHPHHSASPGLEAKDAKSAIAQGLREATNQGCLPHASFTHHAQVHPRRVVLEHRGQHNTLTGRERGQSLLESAGPGTARATWALVNPGNMVKSSQMDGWFHFSGAQVFSKRVENSEVWCLQCSECYSECSFHSERIAKYDSMGRDLKNIGYTACMWNWTCTNNYKIFNTPHVEI